MPKRKKNKQDTKVKGVLPLDPSSVTPAAIQQNVENKQSVRIATFNVLFDFYQHEILFSKERFQKQFDILQELDFDILNLNEVRPKHLANILSQEFVKKYHVSSTQFSDFGSILLSKYKIIKNFKILHSNRQQTRPALFSILEVPLPSSSTATTTSSESSTTSAPPQQQVLKLGVICVHLKAYKQYFPLRMEQLEEIHVVLKQYLESGECDDFVFMGDMNVSQPPEEQLLTKTFVDFVDVWPHLRKGEGGYTFDGTKNALVVKKDASDFDAQFRYDRVIKYLPQNNKMVLVPVDIGMFATEPMYPAAATTQQQHETDTSQGQESQQPDKSYLFPSDHFGLVVTCVFKQ